MFKANRYNFGEEHHLFFPYSKIAFVNMKQTYFWRCYNTAKDIYSLFNFCLYYQENRTLNS